MRITGCKFAEPRLRALIDGELEPREHQRVLLHVEECPRCGDEYARMQSVVSALHEQELEDVPAHFSASLQVRLGRYRRDRKKTWRDRVSEVLDHAASNVRPRMRLAGGLTTLALATALTFVAFVPRLDASEIARRAELSWKNIHNYGCVFLSTGYYQGQPRQFRQQQFYRRPGEFRLDTAKDYPLHTFVYRDRVVHYIPGADWKGKGPIVIVRPRREGQDAVPFPFGVTWQNGGNVSLEQMVRQLTHSPDVEMAGTELVGQRECYRLKFTSVPPGGSQRDEYQVWIDKETYIPRRIHWYRDAENNIVTEAQDLQVNYDVLPAGTFDFRIPDGAFVVHGDVDPHTLALPYVPKRTEAFDHRPVSTAQEQAWEKTDRVAFPVLGPEWLPADFSLVRVRARRGSWVDVHWLREGSGSSQVLKLLQQDGGSEPPADLAGGATITLQTPDGKVDAQILRLTQPYEHTCLTWRQRGTRLTLFAPQVAEKDVIRMAESFVPVQAPQPQVLAVRTPRRRNNSIPRGEPSSIPTEGSVGEPSVETYVAPPSVPHVENTAQPPMMPVMPDMEPMTTTTGAGGG